MSFMVENPAARAALAFVLAFCPVLLVPVTIAWTQAAPQGASIAPIAQVPLVPHRAVYDLTLGDVRGKAQIASVRGRILYDFDGNACQGYSLDFRQVSELNTGEGKTSISDLRSTTWEGADAKTFKFSSENYVDDNLSGAVDGHAEHDPDKTAVTLEKPEKKAFDLAAGVVFPTEHMVRVINAAHEGQNILSFPVYDGSETGEKVFNTLTVIGPKLSADERKHDDAAAGDAKLAAVPRWPVTISYFEQKKADNTSEQTPAYSIGFELYENGISRALTLDYNDFVVTGKLSSLELKDTKPCP
jgi:EipB-like